LRRELVVPFDEMSELTANSLTSCFLVLVFGFWFSSLLVAGRFVRFFFTGRFFVCV
jgi:hypothetical protein